MLTKERLVKEIEKRLNSPHDVTIDLASLTVLPAEVATICAKPGVRSRRGEVRRERMFNIVEQVTWLIINFAHFFVCVYGQ